MLLSAIGYAETGDYGEDTKFTADLKNLKAYLNGDPSADAEQARITKRNNSDFTLLIVKERINGKPEKCISLK